MASRSSVGAVPRIRAATVWWLIVGWSAASVAGPPPADDHPHDSIDSARGTECDKSGAGGEQPSANAAPTKSHPQLTEDNFTAWQTYIRADDTELAWKKIPWLLTFGDGIARADAEGKPLLLWVMNGHPLGCT